VTPFYYDAASDTTCVIAEPKTGRTHQIRLHCEYLKAPIANDPNYSGGAAPPTSAAAPSDDDDNDFMNPCSQAEWDQMMDARCFQCDRKKGECECSVLTFEGDAEKLDEFVRSTCVFCLRKTSDRALKEYVPGKCDDDATHSPPPPSPAPLTRPPHLPSRSQVQEALRRHLPARGEVLLGGRRVRDGGRRRG
jgi:hypothetical protein